MQFFRPIKEPKQFVQRAKFGSRAEVWTALIYIVLTIQLNFNLPLILIYFKNNSARRRARRRPPDARAARDAQYYFNIRKGIKDRN